MIEAFDVDEMLRGALDAPFWQALAKDEVRLPRCEGCGAWVWPARPACGRCAGTSFEWSQVEAAGTVFSWTRVWYPFVESRAHDLPYVVVVVELPSADRARVIGTLCGAEEGLSIGASVRGRVVPPSPATSGLPSLAWELT